MPPHWFRPLNPGPHPLQDGERIIAKFKSKRGGENFAVTACEHKPDPDAIQVRDDDDLDRDDD